MNTVLTSRSFGTPGNRVAAAVDYLPSLRTVCRSERLKEQGKVKRRYRFFKTHEKKYIYERLSSVVNTDGDGNN